MNEEDILKECTELAENEHHELGDCWDEEYSSSAIFGLIMLYKQTKKELNNLKEIEKSHQEENGKLRVELKQEKEQNEMLINEKNIYKDLTKQAQEDVTIWKNLYKQEKEKNKALEEIENKLMPLAECSYWDYEKHTCTHTCRGCDELSSDNRRSHSGILIDKDRYCRLYEDGYAEEDTRYVNVSDLIKRHCKLKEK